MQCMCAERRNSRRQAHQCITLTPSYPQCDTYPRDTKHLPAGSAQLVPDVAWVKCTNCADTGKCKVYRYDEYGRQTLGPLPTSMP